ncbi:hypothetical protein AB0K08_11350 [Citricoccus sp. NPDC055426]|uniref:hypothetical protein n=1 Tax=Citricoccus sp. NPDC055426 TaxID=3155536 RepID=UPI003445D63C
MTESGASHPDGLPLETTVNENPVAIVPMPVKRTGHMDWTALAASLPSPPLDGPHLPMPEGWVRIPVTGFDQVLYWAEGAHYAGVMPQITLRRVRSADPVEALLQQDGGASLALGVEPWVAGTWRGIHGAWSLSRYASTVIRRRWILDGGDEGQVEVVTQHNAYLSRYLTPVLNGLVAGITPAPAGLGGELAADLDSAVDAAERARARLAGDVPTGLLKPTSLDLAARDRIVAGFGGRPGWQITAGGTRTGAAAVGPLGRLWTAGTECLIEQSATGGLGLAQLGRYRRDDAPDMVLRMVGHRAEGPSDVPVDVLPADAFAARLADPAEPLPAELPEGAVVSSHMDPQDIYRWWTADWSWWTLYREAGAGQPTEGIRVLTVRGFGHYLWDASGADGADGAVGAPTGGTGSVVRLQSVDGLALFGVLAELIGTDRS